MQTVKFKPTKLLDPIKWGGTLEVGKVFTGELRKRNNPQADSVVYFTDVNDMQWTFWVGETCEIVEYLEDRPEIELREEKITRLVCELGAEIEEYQEEIKEGPDVDVLARMLKNIEKIKKHLIAEYNVPSEILMEDL